MSQQVCMICNQSRQHKMMNSPVCVCKQHNLDALSHVYLCFYTDKVHTKDKQ